MCRYYRIVGVFAKDVLRGNFLAGKETVNKDDYDRFMRNAAMWHPEIEQLSELTYRKLRQNVFHAMDDARLTKGTDHEIVPALLSNGLLAILEDMATAFEFFPHVCSEQVLRRLHDGCDYSERTYFGAP